MKVSFRFVADLSVLGVRPKKVALQFQPKKPPLLKWERAKVEKYQLCVTALSNSPQHPLPSKCLLNSSNDLQTVQTSLWDVRRALFDKSHKL